MWNSCALNTNNKVTRYSQVHNEYRCSYHHCRFLGNVLWEHPVNQCRWSCKFSNTHLWLSGLGETNPRIIKRLHYFKKYTTLTQLTNHKEMVATISLWERKQDGNCTKLQWAKTKSNPPSPHNCSAVWHKYTLLIIRNSDLIQLKLLFSMSTLLKIFDLPANNTAAFYMVQ